jgi:hypothetical protein
MAKSKEDNLDDTKRLMGPRVRMKPKSHEEMKVGKKKIATRAARDPKKAHRKAVTAD